MQPHLVMKKGGPSTFELINPSDQAQDLGGDLKGVRAKHRTNNTPNNTHLVVFGEINGD